MPMSRSLTLFEIPPLERSSISSDAVAIRASSVEAASPLVTATAKFCVAVLPSEEVAVTVRSTVGSLAASACRWPSG